MDEPGEGELLTGAQLYLHLLRQNEQQLASAERKLREYTALEANLRHITEHSRRAVLAPVAGGLAYFAAELRETNNILVLLGDGWFAERSACQAVDIAERRIDFLRREVSVLQQEARNLQERRELMLAEVPAAQAAMQDTLDALPAAVTGTARQTTTSASAQRGTATTDKARSSTAATTSSATSKDQNAVAGTMTAAAVDDDGLTTFDEQDELTEDELIAIEHELGDRVNDDAYVERILTERMIAKKERRMQAELARRTTDKRASAATHAPSAAPLYRTPADIAAAAAAAAAATKTDTLATAAPPSASGAAGETCATAQDPDVDSPPTRRPTSGKRVSFAPEVLAAEERKAATSSPPPPQQRMRSVHLGDIVEHVDNKESASTSDGAAAHAATTAHATRPKRRSLFMQEQE